MKGVILDKSSFDRNDVDLSSLSNLKIQWTSYPSTRNDEVIQRVSNQDIVITNKVAINDETLASTDKLKLILIAATGTDNVDLKICQEKRITVCNVRHYSTPAVVQHSISLMLNLMTKQPQYAQDVGQGKWVASDVFCLLDYPIVESEGKTLGIIGYGTLGKRVADVAKALGMSVILCQRPGTKAQNGRVPFPEFLQKSDVISLHCPLTDETRNLFSHKEFAAMKSEAIIINTARGAIIDSDALVKALQTGEIGGAGIDVLDVEPPLKTHALLQDNIPNLIVTPHNAWGTRESRQRLIDVMAENLLAWESGDPINTVC
jgi:glycerate dehydrogenase